MIKILKEAFNEKPAELAGGILLITVLITLLITSFYFEPLFTN